MEFKFNEYLNSCESKSKLYNRGVKLIFFQFFKFFFLSQRYPSIVAILPDNIIVVAWSCLSRKAVIIQVFNSNLSFNQTELIIANNVNEINFKIYLF